MNEILRLCIIVFMTQLIFIGARTINVRAIADNNRLKAMTTGAVIHLSWLVSIAIRCSINE